MIPRAPVNFSFWMVPFADWAEYFGVDYPETRACILGRLRPTSRTATHVLAECSLMDSTPSKERWGKQRGRPGGPTLAELAARPGVHVHHGVRPGDRHANLPDDVAEHLFRVDVYRRDDGDFRAEVEAAPYEHQDQLAHELWKRKPEVRRRRVPLAQVKDSDVLGGHPVRPYRFAGEK